MVARSAPGVNDVALGIEFDNVGRRDTAVAPGRVERRHRLVRVEVRRAADDPYVVAIVHGHGGHALLEPSVRIRHLGPEGIDLVLRDRHILSKSIRCRSERAKDSRSDHDGKQRIHLVAPKQFELRAHPGSSIPT